MSYKSEMKHKIEMALNTESQNDVKTMAVIENMYEKALEESKKTGQSIASITYEILEGLEEGYASKPQKVEHILQHATAIITQVIHHSAINNIEKQHQQVRLAHEVLLDTIEAEKIHLSESLEAFEHYAHDNEHHSFKESLRLTEINILKKIHFLSSMLKYKTILHKKESKEIHASS